MRRATWGMTDVLPTRCRIQMDIMMSAEIRKYVRNLYGNDGGFVFEESGSFIIL